MDIKKAPVELTTGAFINDVRRRSTLPQGPPCSTIDAIGLNFRVRNGTGCFPYAKAAETLLSYQVKNKNTLEINLNIFIPDRSSGTTQ